MFKRIMSFVLVLVMAVGMIPAPAAAAETSVDTSNMSLEGNNSLGSLLSDEIEQYQAQEESGAYGVVGLSVSGNTATVEYSAMEDAKLVVAIYTEDGIQMVTSGSKTVTAGEGEATVTIAGTMPEYFMAEAFLVDSYDYSPLCTSYSTPIYTKSMQELLASDVNDYEEALVLNLDSDESTNFLVYDEGTILVEEQAGVNTVLSANDETMTYVIGNADDTFLWLQEGDVVSYAYGEDQLLFVKVASIDVEGTTVTIQGAEITLDDVFSHIKIEDSGMAQDAIVDASSADMTYTGISEAAPAGGASLQDVNGTLSKYLTFETRGINMGVKVDLTFAYYDTPDNKHMELRTDLTLSLSLHIEGKKEFSLRCGKWAFPMAAGAVDFVCEPELKATFTAAVDAGATLTFTTGFTYGEAQGFKELNTPPRFTMEVKVEGIIFIGLDLCPGVEVLKGLVLDVGASLPVGVEITATRAIGFEAGADKGVDVLHGCTTCLDISVDAKADLTVEVELASCLKKNCNIIGVKVHLCDLYYSFEHKEFGKGRCPYRKYLTTILVKDENGSTVSEATVFVDGEKLGQTNRNGVKTDYIDGGSHSIGAVCEERSKTTTVEISEARTVEVVIPAPKETEPEETEPTETQPGATEEPTAPTETPDDGIPGVFGDVETSIITRPGDVLDSYNNYFNLSYEIYANGLMVISGVGPLDLPISSYGSYVREIRILDGITEIPDDTFMGTRYGNLEKITIPKTVEYIGHSAFAYHKNLKNIKINSNQLIIAQNAFMDCKSLSSIYLPDGVAQIGMNAFYGCTNLRSVRLPDTLTEIGDNAFSGCSSLTEITLPDSLTRIPNSLFRNCESLRKVTIPHGVTSIEYSAFYGCKSLREIVIPDSVTTIGEYAFTSCESLSKVALPDHITKIPENCFGWTALERIDIPEGVTEIGDYAFAWCKNLDKVTLPESLEVIGDSAFSGCGELKEIEIPDSVTSIGQSAFDQSGLETISIPDGVELGSMAFGYTPMEEVWFEGDCPTVIENEDMPWLQVFQRFGDTMLTGFFPADNPTWTWQNLPMGLSNFRWYPYTVNENGERIVDWAGTLPWVEEELPAEGAVPEEAVPEETIPEETVPEVTVPEETIPEETIPEETIPEETIPEETVPEETISEETIPEETVPAEAAEPVAETVAETAPENILMSFLNSFALRASAAEAETVPETEAAEEPEPMEPSTEPVKVLPDIPEMPTRPTPPEPPVIPEEIYDPELSAIFGGEYDVVEGTTYSLFTATFSGLVPGEDYVLLDMASVSVADPLAPGNLLAIRQGTADSSGYLVFEYAQRYDSSSSYIVACGPSSQNLEEAFVIFPDMEANGELQAIDPTVEYYGAILKEGRDYVLLGQVSFTEAGTYTCYVRGIQNYTGLVKCTYTVEAEPVPQITVTGSSSVEAGSSVTLTASFAYEPEAGTEVTWTLADGDEAYAALTPNGNSVTVTALDVAQTTVVTVTASAPGKALAGAFQLTITPRVPLAESIALYQVYYDANGQEVWFDLSQSERWFYELEDWMTQGFSIQLNAIVSPVGADSRVYWSSSDPAVANIDPESGLVSFTGNPGVVTLFASAADGSGVYSGVTFEIRGGAKLEPEGGTDIHLLAGKAHTFKILNKDTGKYINAKDIVWSIYAGGEDPTAFATVKNGKLTAQKVLTQASFWVYAEIYQNGKYTNTIEYSVTVYPAVTHMEVLSDGVLSNGKTVPFNLADTTQMVISAQMYPDDVMNVPVKWTISDNKNAYADYTIDGNTVLIRNPKNKNGTVTFKAESTDGSKKSATVKVQFATFAQSVTITSTQTEMNAGSSLQLSAYTTPEKPTKSGITWSLKNAADKNYASISSSGKLQGKTVYGETPVTLVAASKDGMASAEYTVTILPKDPGVLILKQGDKNVTKSTINVDLNTETEIRLTALNFGTGEAAPVTWKSSSAKAAPVDENGVVTILGKGNVTITATGADKQKATVILKIAPLASEVIAQEGAEVASGKAVKLTAQVLGVAKGQVTWSIVDGTQYGKLASSGTFTAGKDITSKQEVTVRAAAKDGGIYDDTVVTLRPIAQGVQIYTVENGVQTFSIDSNAGWLVRSNTSYTWDINQGKTVQLSAHVYPYYGENHDKNAIQGVKWASSAKNVATVDENGLVTCLKTGTTTITATAADGSGKKVSFKLTVVKTITALRMADQTVVGGKNLNLAKLITIEPSDATNKNLSWQILGGDGVSTVTLSSKGELKTKKVTSAQTVRIRAEATDGSEQFVTFTVTINPA